MTDNATNNSSADSVSGSALIDDQDDFAGEFDEIDELPDDLVEADEPAATGGLSAGAVSGGFGFAGLALAIVSLTTNWTGGVVASRAQYVTEVGAPSSGLSEQAQLNMYSAAWHTEGVWALSFAAAAMLFGLGALVLPRLRRSGRPVPGWATAAGSGALIVGLIGLVLAVLTVIGVFGGHLVAPASAASAG
jgi:hypothetical protein